MREQSSSPLHRGASGSEESSCQGCRAGNAHRKILSDLAGDRPRVLAALGCVHSPGGDGDAPSQGTGKGGAPGLHSTSSDCVLCPISVGTTMMPEYSSLTAFPSDG